MTLARDYDIRYGRNLVKTESADWPRYIVVSTPTAWKTAKPFLSREPAGLVFNQWLDRAHLEETTASLPDDAELAVGIGAGRALDHAKVVAERKGIPLVQVPTVVSTGAIIHSLCGDWAGRVIHGWAADVVAEYVLIDYDLVLKAPERLNTAGLGDVLCGYAGLSEWRYNAAKGIGEPFDESIAAVAIDHHQEIVDGFPQTLADDGALTDESVKFIMQAVQGRDERMLRHPAAPGADHSFCFSVELANDRFWIHGETCALGAVMVAWHTEQDPGVLVGRLDRCKVRFRPRDLGMSEDELRKGLEALPAWMGDEESGRDINSVMRHDPLVGERFDQAWAWLEGV